MYFEQIKTPGLGCFSYVIGCPEEGIMAVIDPRRDIGIYLDIAKEEDMLITHIFETHVHADHISGAPDLRAATGADIYIHESADVSYESKKLKDGDEFALGAAGFRVLHTPGHTPNSVSFLCFDLARSAEPEMILTGDLLFVGDIGRPDLPGEAILYEQVENLYNSLYKTLATLPGYLEVYPAHGEGSLCGKGMSSKPHTTIGYELWANEMLRFPDFMDFRHVVLENLPMRPQSFTGIINANLKGEVSMSISGSADYVLSPAQVSELINNGATVLDLRNPAVYCVAHIPGSINVGLADSSMINWVGVAVPHGVPLVLVLPHNRSFDEVRVDLSRIGYDDIEGWLDGGVDAWVAEGRDIRSIPIISADDLRENLAKPNPPMVIDVRSKEEFAAKSIEGSINLTFDKITGSDDCPVESNTKIVVVCLSGYRATIAASLLTAKGCSDVTVMSGGINAW